MLQRERELKKFCTLGIGGSARYFLEARSLEELIGGVRFAKTEGCPLIVIGKGSNCLFDDRGFDGLVIYNNIQHVEFSGDGVVVSAGYSFARLGLAASRRGLGGLEFAAGIPGSVGGAVFMNAGAGGSDVSKVLTSCHWIDEAGDIHLSEREALEFGYRSSNFQLSGGWIVGAQFALREDVGAKARCQALLAKRLETQPYGEKTAGCFFRNPEGGCAGEWIERLGLKGLRVGGAMVSTLHANFIVNCGGAKSADVWALVEKIQERVEGAFGGRLELEVCSIPYVKKAIDVSS